MRKGLSLDYYVSFIFGPNHVKLVFCDTTFMFYPYPILLSDGTVHLSKVIQAVVLLYAVRLSHRRPIHWQQYVGQMASRSNVPSMKKRGAQNVRTSSETRKPFPARLLRSNFHASCFSAKSQKFSAQDKWLFLINGLEIIIQEAREKNKDNCKTLKWIVSFNLNEQSRLNFWWFCSFPAASSKQLKLKTLPDLKCQA